jgi:peptidoglycan/xylan/chitin deacetylase (PgdA/CDA1 family)
MMPASELFRHRQAMLHMRISTARQVLLQFSARLIGRKVVPFRSAHPIISFTFDDYPRSALDLGGRILASEGISATYYTAFGLARTDSPSGMIGSLDDLAACVAAGHEIACHSHDHFDCQNVSADEFARNLSRNRKVARDLGLPPLRHFAYPFGRSCIVGKRIAMQSYVSARTTIWGVNRANLDLGLLKSVPIYSRNGPPCLTSFLDELQSDKGWLILYTHDVSRHPSSYGCTPKELSSVIRRARAMGALILPVGAVVNQLTGRPS